nr:unnamed protein product [Digitaria exilis]
MFRKHKRT